VPVAIASREHLQGLWSIAQHPSQRDGSSMDAIRLETNDNLIECPRQGQLHVEYCLGCPRRISVDQTKSRTVVICEPGDEHLGSMWEPLRSSPPAPFRLYED
jgi:hypothetical protein